MSGTKAGGLKVKETLIKRHGENFFKEIGSKGGKVCCPKGFALNPELAKVAGQKGGKISKRGKAKNEITQ